MGPAVRQGDEQWFNIVRWTLFALINAEELDVTAAGVDELEGQEQDAARAAAAGRRRHASARTWGSMQTGLLRAIKATGNYGEIFNRNLGKDSPLAIERGINACGMRGGLLYAPPVR